MTETRQLLRFDDEVAIVTGAGRGLGREHALLLAARGARVIVNDVGVSASGSHSDSNRQCAASVVDEIRAVGGSATPDEHDVALEPAAIVQTALDTWGRLDIVVNNAGIVGNGRFITRPLANFEAMLRVHVLGTVGVTRAAWAALAEAGGRVVNTTSGAVLGLGAHSDYATAKGAVLAFTRSVAIDGQRDGIRVNAIMPMAHTRMFAAAGGIEGSAEEAAMRSLFPARSVSPMVAVLAHRSVPCSGEVVDIAGGLASRVVLGLGPNVRGTSPEDFSQRFGALMNVEELTVVTDLETVLAAKAAMLMGESPEPTTTARVAIAERGTGAGGAS